MPMMNNDVNSAILAFDVIAFDPMLLLMVVVIC